MLHQDGASGVLKLNSKMLQPTELRKLDKLEKCLLVEVAREGKGETVLLLYPPHDKYKQLTIYYTLY